MAAVFTPEKRSEVMSRKLDALALAIGGGHRVVAPFPVPVRDGKAHIAARPGVNYEG